MKSLTPDLIPRIKTALILFAIIMVAMFFFSYWLFMFFTGILTLIAAWEWTLIAGVKTITRRAFFVITIFWLLFVICELPVTWIWSAALLMWVVIVFMLFRFARLKKNSPVWFNVLAGLIILPAVWQALNMLCFTNPHPYQLLALFFFIWVADTAAYFCGTRWGKHKLAPDISPGKSIEGAVAALIATIILSVAITVIGEFAWPYIFIAIISVMSSIVGDLFESMLKRQQGLKDSGTLLPGHGGLLDRIDSLTAAAPIFALGLWLIGSI